VTEAEIDLRFVTGKRHARLAALTPDADPFELGPEVIDQGNRISLLQQHVRADHAALRRVWQLAQQWEHTPPLLAREVAAEIRAAIRGEI
jgi:hypothetical protein